MAKYSYSTYIAASKKESRGGDGKFGKDRKVGYFKLVNDGDKAVVRFDYDNPEQFEVYDVHQIKTAEGRYRNVLCLKETPYDPDSKCPLCEAGYDDYPLRTKFYVKLIQYVQGEDGRIKAEPKVWERPAGFVKDLKSMIDDYGDLRDVVFIVSRNGERGSRDTTYSINMALPAKYNEQTGYVKDFSGFEGFGLAGHSFMSRTAEECKAFIATGDFPMRSHDHSKDVAKPEADYLKPKGAQAIAERPSVLDLDDDPFGGADNPLAECPPSSLAPESVKADSPASDPTVSRPRRVYNYN